MKRGDAVARGASIQRRSRGTKATERLKKNKTADVLIVGAGPTGLVMACELVRRGLACRIIDKSSLPSDKSKALAIQARTLEIFENMGVVRQFIEAGLQVHAANVYAEGKRILRISMGKLDSPYPFILTIPQSETERILTEHLAELGVKVERNAEFTGLEQGEETITARIKSGGSETLFESSWLIGCDGAHSIVRHALNLQFEGSRYRETFLLADVEVESSLESDEPHLFNSRDGFAAFIPFGGRRYRVIADTPSHGEQAHETALVAHHSEKNDGKVIDPTLEEMQALVAARCFIQADLKNPQWLKAFAIHRRQVPTYRKDRVFLAGDAAHIHSPAGGQGMNTGIQDAFNLAWKLELVHKNIAFPSLLDSYNTERHEVAENVLKMTDFLTRVNTLRNPVAQAVRNRIAPFLVGQEVIQQRLRRIVSELAVSYRKSPIVSEHHAHLLSAHTGARSFKERLEFREWFQFDSGPRSGDRAPDAHVFSALKKKTVRLFEIMRGTGHHLLLLPAEHSSSETLRNLAEIGNYVMDAYSPYIKVHLFLARQELWTDLPWGGSQFADTDLELHHKYGAGSECLYLVRPDGYVAFRSRPHDKTSLSDYLRQVFI